MYTSHISYFIFLCVSHIHIKDCLSWPHILPQWIFRLDLMGQTSAQCQYTFSIILKQKEKMRRVIIFPLSSTWLKIQPWDSRRTAAESMAASSNVNSKHEGLDFYTTMALFWLKGMTDITVVNHSPFLYLSNHKMSLLPAVMIIFQEFST